MDSGRLAPGKLPHDLLAALLSSLPLPPEVRLGPALGEDACAIDVPAGVLIAATDPITLTCSDVGRYSVIINANDVAVMGVRPRWFLAAVLLPVGTTADDTRELFAGLTEALTAIGASLVGGHTEVTEAVNQPVVVGQMLGLAEHGSVVTSRGARVGDVLVQVGPVPIEGAAVLAGEAADRLSALDPAVREAAARAVTDPGISVVEPALAAAGLGATAMHDPTEGGLAAALHELAAAAGTAIRVDRDAVRWFGPGIAVCDALGADPWATLASGALLATFPPEGIDDVMATFTTRRMDAAPIGAIEEGRGVHDRDGTEIPWPDRDEVARLLGG